MRFITSALLRGLIRVLSPSFLNSPNFKRFKKRVQGFSSQLSIIIECWASSGSVSSSIFTRLQLTPSRLYVLCKIAPALSTVIPAIRQVTLFTAKWARCEGIVVQQPSFEKGSENENVLPTFTSLSNSSLPPISSTRCLLIVRPKPVPPYFLEMLASA